MPTKQTHSRKGLKPPKRHSTGYALKVYWPYLPMIALLLGGLFLNVWQPLQSHKPATLAYATEMSRGGLLSSTNTQRANNGVGALTLNSQLNAAAQAKANDMVARDYWSHNTPDGQEPWVFIDAQGYAYTKAGENLAYGFSTSNATVVGWMNSPSHRANMLDGVFTEVGFGFANSANFVGTGEETVVVAMYAKPVSAPAPPPPAPAPTPEPTPTPQTQPASTSVAPTSVPPEETPEPAEETTPVEIVDDTVVPANLDDDQPITTDQAVPTEATPQRITLLQQLTGGSAPWSAVIVSSIGFGLALLWITKHFVLVRRFVIEGEHFVAHHPILDLVVLSIVAAAVYLSQSSGVIL